MFVQPYGLGSASGGGRILRSMIKGQPFDSMSVNTGFEPEKSVGVPEEHWPVRPSLGRLDRTRWSNLGNYLETFSRRFFARKFSRYLAANRPDVVHILPHKASDFPIAWQLSRKRGIRVVMSIHDDLIHNLGAHPLRHESEAMLQQIWQEVPTVFVISEELGREYARRYGQRDYVFLTDGVDNVPDQVRPVLPQRLHVYFMGQFHYMYGDNLRQLARTLATLKSRRPGMDIRLTLRCGGLPQELKLDFPVEVLPFSDQTAVEHDMETADVVYLPLQFGTESADFIRYSLSTKMVTYLASGIPILYHGPAAAAAGKLLATHSAAFLATSLDEATLVSQLQQALDPVKREAIGQNALALARQSFQVTTLREKFLHGLFPSGVTAG